MAEKLFTLQSGFVAINPTELEMTPENRSTLRDSLYASDFRIGDNVNLYDEGIERLFSQFRKDNNLITNFEFRELILKAAFRVFNTGTDSIAPWLRAQVSQRTVGYIHRKFLVETLRLIHTGEKRTMDAYTYHRLTEAEDTGNRSQPGSDRPNDVLLEYISTRNDYSLTRLITGWTDSIDGFVDLLKSLEVIFGKRTGYMAPVRHVDE